MKFKKICTCGKEFDTNRETGRFCNKKCRLEYMKNSYSNGKRKELLKESYLGKRFKILKRDNFQCKYCGRNVIDDKIKLQIDHLIPLNKNGNNDESNLITSCSDCNNGKGDTLLEQRQIEKLKISILKKENNNGSSQ